MRRAPQRLAHRRHLCRGEKSGDVELHPLADQRAMYDAQRFLRAGPTSSVAVRSTPRHQPRPVVYAAGDGCGTSGVKAGVLRDNPDCESRNFLARNLA